MVEILFILRLCCTSFC